MSTRAMSCATCGAKAPELAEDQGSFVCSYCEAQTFVERARPPDVVRAPDEPMPELRPRRPAWPLVLLVAVLIALGIVVMVRAHAPGSELADCKSFTGEASRATWQSCASKATFTIACEPTFSLLPGADPRALPGGFTCNCLRDGAKTWFFEAKSLPPLASREGAERVAEASCKMW